MEFQLTSDFIIDKNKNVGNVLFVVEGQSTEINVLIRIFNKVLGYQVNYKKRENRHIRCCELRNQNNKYSRIIIVNSKHSNIASINEKDYIENELIEITKEYKDLNIDIKNIQKYFLFDCDRKEDQKNIEDLLNKYNNSLDSGDDYSLGGLLLLSYPSIESFIITNFKIDSYLINDPLINEGRIKEYNNKNRYLPNKFNSITLKTAINEFAKALNNIGTSSINLDDMSSDNIKVYKYELEKDNKYILSLLSIALIDMGIIKFIN